MKRLFFILLFIPLALAAQEDILPVEMELKYLQRDTNFELTASLVDEDGEPVKGVDVLFTAHVNGSSNTLGTAVTNPNGVAIIKKELKTLRELGHQFHLEAVFTGNTAYDATSSEIDITDVSLTVTTEIVDSLYIAAIQVMKWNTDMSEEPVPDIDILFYVPRLFSLLPVGEAYTNKQGSDEFEFPMDLPGQNGELTIVSRIEDHDDFGTIEVSNETNWGVPIANGNSKLPRALWSPDAPMWMLISFFILMAGVWGHYLYVVINMFQIQKSGNVNDALNYIE